MLPRRSLGGDRTGGSSGPGSGNKVSVPLSRGGFYGEAHEAKVGALEAGAAKHPALDGSGGGNRVLGGSDGPHLVVAPELTPPQLKRRELGTASDAVRGLCRCSGGAPSLVVDHLDGN